MKKVSYVIFCVLGLLTLSSCKIDDVFKPKPSVKFIDGDGLYTHNSITRPGSTLHFKIEVAPNDSSLIALESYSFMIFDLNHSSTEPVYENAKTFEANDFSAHIFDESYNPLETAYLQVVAKATDVEQISNEVQLIIDVIEPGIRLGSYEGTLQATGTLQSDFAFLDNVPMEIPMHTILLLDSIPNKDRLNATIIIEGVPMTVECTRNGNLLTLDESSFNLTFNHVEDIDMVFHANLTAIFLPSNDQIEINGNLFGSGHTAVYTNMTAVDWVNGQLKGILQKNSRER